MKSLLSFFFPVCLVFALGCGSSDGTSESKPEVKKELNMAEELTPPVEMTEIKDSEIARKINDVLEFYQRTPKSDSDNSGADDAKNCEAYKNSHIAAGMGYLEIEMSGDLKGCLSGSGVQLIESVSVSMYARVECPEDDLSSLNGIAMTELPKYDTLTQACPLSTTVRNLNWSRMEAVVNFFGKTKTTSSTGTASTDGKLCSQSIQNGLLTYGDCVKFSRRHQELLEGSGNNTTSDGKLKLEPSNYLTTLNLAGLSGDGKSSFFTNGKADFRVNNWQGSMIYRGPENNPSWSARSGEIEKLGAFTGKAKKNNTKGFIESLLPL